MASGRRVSLADLGTDDFTTDQTTAASTEPADETRVILAIPVEKIGSTLFNPREDFGSDEELDELGESLRVRQIQPIVVVSRAAYEKLVPALAAELAAGVEYVLVSGERRWRAASRVKLQTLETIVRDDYAESRKVYLDAVLTENFDRRNFNPIEEAHAVEAMVGEFNGSLDEAAAYWRKSKGWISQRRGLLRLIPDLQKLIVSGEMPVRVGRVICNVDPEAQWDAWIKSQQPEPREEAQEVVEDSPEAAIPAPRTEPLPPSFKASAKLIARYRQANGADALAQLVYADLEPDEAVTFALAAVRHLSEEAATAVLNAFLERDGS